MATQDVEGLKAERNRLVAMIQDKLKRKSTAGGVDAGGNDSHDPPQGGAIADRSLPLDAATPPQQPSRPPRALPRPPAATTTTTTPTTTATPSPAADQKPVREPWEWPDDDDEPYRPPRAPATGAAPIPAARGRGPLPASPAVAQAPVPTTPRAWSSRQSQGGVTSRNAGSPGGSEALAALDLRESQADASAAAAVIAAHSPRASPGRLKAGRAKKRRRSGRNGHRVASQPRHRHYERGAGDGARASAPNLGPDQQRRVEDLETDLAQSVETVAGLSLENKRLRETVAALESRLEASLTDREAQTQVFVEEIDALTLAAENADLELRQALAKAKAAEARATAAEAQVESARGLLMIRMMGGGHRAAAAAEQRSASEERFWAHLATPEVLAHSLPPADYPVLAPPKAPTAELEAVRNTLRERDAQVKTLTKTLGRLEDKLGRHRAAAAQHLALRKKHGTQRRHLMGAVRRIHWLLADAAKAKAKGEAREKYVARIEAKLIEQDGQVRRLRADLAAAKKLAQQREPVERILSPRMSGRSGERASGERASAGRRSASQRGRQSATAHRPPLRDRSNRTAGRGEPRDAASDSYSDDSIDAGVRRSRRSDGHRHRFNQPGGLLGGEEAASDGSLDADEIAAFTRAIEEDVIGPVA